MDKRILVIDDNKFNVKLLSEILTDEGYTVYSEYSGESILEKCNLYQPDAILLDIMMPGIDGFEVCRILKDDSKTYNIPVIMVTAKTDPEDLKYAFELGAFDYIKKPIDESEVLARLDSALRFSQRQRQLEDLAMKDGLTNLYNHRLIIELFYKEFEKSTRNKQPIAFMMLDLDHFKEVNDTFGHQVGDQVLKDISLILMENSRSSDVIGRYGGEEFSITLPNVSKEDAYIISERIRHAVENFTHLISQAKLFVTVSIGICVHYPDSKKTAQDVIAEADKALYLSKSGGRNRTEVVVLDGTK